MASLKDTGAQEFSIFFFRFTSRDIFSKMAFKGTISSKMLLKGKIHLSFILKGQFIKNAS